MGGWLVHRKVPSRALGTGDQGDILIIQQRFSEQGCHLKMLMVLLPMYQLQMFPQTPNSALSKFRFGKHWFWPLNQARRP